VKTTWAPEGDAGEFALRVTHRVPIGARRTEPVGYFRMVDAEDWKEGLRPYREQVISGWRTLRALDSEPALRELLGQLTFEGDERR
jgi:hypothetical protein